MRMESALADSVRHRNMNDRAKVFVLCPFRRVSLYEGTRSHLLGLGFQRAQVGRREGYDGKKHSYLPRCKFLTAFMRDMGLPLLKRTFRAHPNLDVIFMLEDDCRVQCDLDGLLSAALAAGAAIGWLGYMLKGGKPRYGAHCVSYSRSCLERLENLLTAPGSDLPAWDTCLYQWHRKDPQLVWVPPVSLARQHVHEFIGRR